MAMPRSNTSPPPSRPRTSTAHRLFVAALFVLAAYAAVAYIAMPLFWRVDLRSEHPALVESPRHAFTALGIPGDPLNIAVVGEREALIAALRSTGWFPADRVDLSSSLHIAEAVVLRHPYPTAPVSSLYLFGRRQDLAFERPVGHDPRRREHVRFWQAPRPDAAGRPLWIGSATFDAAVELSRTTGQITHHIAPDVDAERDRLVADLQRSPQFERLEWKDDFQPSGTGRNGGGDPYQTDRRLAVVVLD